jgi:hypothetical protein
MRERVRIVEIAMIIKANCEILMTIKREESLSYTFLNKKE